MSDGHDELFVKFLGEFIYGASEDALKSIGVSPSDDELSPGPTSNDNDDNKHPDLDPHAVQALTSEPNFDDNLGNQPVREPSMPPSSSPAKSPTDRETKHRKKCDSLYRCLLSHRADTEATVLSAGDLFEMLKKMGMSPAVTKDDLLILFKTSGYADESTGLLEFEYFLLFAKDYKLLESVLAYGASQQKGGKYSEQGPLLEFFYAAAKYREELDVIDCFEKLLLKQRGDPTATVLRAGNLCEMLKILGMPTTVKEVELQSTLQVLSYADGNGTMDFERFMKFAGDFKLFESLRAFKASQRKGVEYVERGPLSHHASQRVPELQYSALKSCRGDPNTTALLEGSFWGMLKELGMAPEVTDDELRDTLKFSGYTDEDGTLGFELFTILARDFVLIESPSRNLFAGVMLLRTKVIVSDG